MKIILVNKFHYLKGGSETYYFGLAEGLKALGHEVHFFAMEGPENVPCEDSDLFVSAKDYNGPTSLPQKVSAATSLIYSNEARDKFQALCERVHPDVVHMNLVHRQITLSILDAPYLKQHRVPVLFTSHDYILVCPNYVMLDGSGAVCDACVGGHFSNCLKRKCVKGSTAKSGMGMLEAECLKLHGSYSKIDCIVAPSQFMRNKLLEGGFPTQQVVYMQNFAKQEILDNAADSTDRTDRDDPYLLFFGRLSSEKGVDILVEAFINALPSLPGNLRLVIAGDGPERQGIEGRIASAGPEASGRIELVGYQSGVDIRRYTERACLPWRARAGERTCPIPSSRHLRLEPRSSEPTSAVSPNLLMRGALAFFASLAMSILCPRRYCAARRWSKTGTSTRRCKIAVAHTSSSAAPRTST